MEWPAYGTIAVVGLLLGYALHTGFWGLRFLYTKQPDRWSTLLSTLALAVLTGLTLEFRDLVLPTPFSWIVLGFGLFCTYFATLFVVGQLQKRLDEGNHFLQALLEQDERTRRMLERFNENVANLKLEGEARRKLPHLLTALVFPVAYGGGAYLGQGLIRALGVVQADPNGEPLQRTLALLEGPDLVAASLPFTFAVLLMLMVAVGANEFVRVRFPKSQYAFRSLIEGTKRSHEVGGFGAHYHILVAAPTALLVLLVFFEPRPALDAWTAIFFVTIVSDAVSALAGKRWGRTKWHHNPGKSYLGTFAGSGVAILGASIFVGWPLAIAFAVAYALIDGYAPVPFNVTDNLLIPLGLAGLTVVLAQLGLATPNGWAF